MTARLVTPRCAALLLLLTVAGGGWCQTLLLDPAPRACRTQDNAAAGAVLSQGRRNEYPAGGVLMLLAKVPAGLFGSLQVFLCPDSDAEVECEDRVPLELADGSGTSYSLQKVPRTDRYEIPVILSNHITCPACTLQVRVLTRDCAEAVEAPCPEKEVTFCSDITIRDIKLPAWRSKLKGMVQGWKPGMNKVSAKVREARKVMGKIKNVMKDLWVQFLHP
ncbi:uncharacterized protein LOC135111865 [Scylla paramamosain]|uniref:uncharacterized protein LOC135111865 n=1 Tax=Scylla paramamosain TaxID=85552 RepID=UPI003083ED64